MKLKSQFDSFYKKIRIDSEVEALREKREILQEDIKTRLPGIFKEHGITLNKSDIDIFDQGSYKYNTTIKSAVVDRDVAIMIPLENHEQYTPTTIKKYLEQAIGYVAARTVEIKEPCVRVVYYEDGVEWMHIDLPLYVIDNGNIYLARGKKSSTGEWEQADPKGLNEYLCDHINGKPQLRRIICFIKKWKNEKYENAASDHSVPPSIGLTLLACSEFRECSVDNVDDDLTALYNTMNGILSCFSVQYNFAGEPIQADISKMLPVVPYSDVFKKMRDSSADYMLTFYKRWKVAVNNLIDAINCSSEHDAAKCVQKVLGEEFDVPLKEVAVGAVTSKKEHGFG